VAHVATCAAAIAFDAGLDIAEVSDFFEEAGVPPEAA
jgi:hypothetical protein